MASFTSASNGCILHRLQHCHRPHIPGWLYPLHCQGQVCDENLGSENSSQSLQPQPCSLPSCLGWQFLLEIISFLCIFCIFSGIGTMICLPASVWLLNNERSYEEKTFQIQIPNSKSRPMHIWIGNSDFMRCNGFKNIPTLDDSTESNFWKSPIRIHN